MIDFAHTHSIVMLTLTAVDVVIIVLLVPEYRRLKGEIARDNQDARH